MPELKDFKEGDKVVYIPGHLLMGTEEESVLKQNLGTVSFCNDHYAFVMFINHTTSQACYASDLYSIKNRPELIKLLHEFNDLNK